MASISEWLRPHRTVPVTPWSAGESNWKATPKSYVALIFGLWLFGTGEAALVAANAGVSPWTVFAQGISKQTGLSIGWATFFISLAALSLWIPLKRKPGLGTVMNIFVIAFTLQNMIPFFPEPTNKLLQIVQVLVGVVIVGFGSAFYITSNLGPGPRDGLMTGIHFRTGIRVGRVRTGIEATVLVVGWLLGGTVGIGTVIFAVLVGQSIAMAFGIVSRISPR